MFKKTMFHLDGFLQWIPKPHDLYDANYNELILSSPYTYIQTVALVVVVIFMCII